MIHNQTKGCNTHYVSKVRQERRPIQRHSNQLHRKKSRRQSEAPRLDSLPRSQIQQSIHLKPKDMHLCASKARHADQRLSGDIIHIRPTQHSGSACDVPSTTQQRREILSAMVAVLLTFSFPHVCVTLPHIHIYIQI